MLIPTKLELFRFIIDKIIYYHIKIKKKNQFKLSYEFKVSSLFSNPYTCSGLGSWNKRAEPRYLLNVCYSDNIKVGLILTFIISYNLSSNVLKFSLLDMRNHQNQLVNNAMVRTGANFSTNMVVKMHKRKIFGLKDQSF